MDTDMKLLHLGDLHIGKTLGEYDLKEDQKYILDQIIQIADERGADGILIAGDVYDKSVPSEAAVSLFDYFICKLVEKQIPAFIISGNHDSDIRLQFGSDLFKSSQIFIAAKYEGTLQRHILKDKEGEVFIYLLPFVKASQVKHFFPEEQVDTYEQAVRVIIDHAQIDPEKRNILVAHQFVAGKGEDPELGGSEGLAVQNVGTVEKIGYECFEKFDYVALGHIHAPQKVGREEIRYAGSPLKYSLSEIHHQKSVPLVSLGKKGEVKTELIPLKPLRDMRHVKGKMEKLLCKENLVSTGDFMYVTLTEEEIVDNAMGIFRQYYPNILKLDYDNSHTKEIEEVDFAGIGEHISFQELLSDFYTLVYGCEIGEEERKLMEEAAREAGILQ